MSNKSRNKKAKRRARMARRVEGIDLSGSDREIFQRVANNVGEQLQGSVLSHDNCIIASRIIDHCLRVAGYRTKLVGCITVGIWQHYHICIVNGGDDPETWEPAHAVTLAYANDDRIWYLIDATLSQLHYNHSVKKFPKLGPQIIPMSNWDGGNEFSLRVRGSEDGIDGDIELIYEAKLDDPLWFADAPDMTVPIEKLLTIAWQLDKIKTLKGKLK